MSFCSSYNYLLGLPEASLLAGLCDLDLLLPALSDLLLLLSLLGLPDPLDWGLPDLLLSLRAGLSDPALLGLPDPLLSLLAGLTDPSLFGLADPLLSLLAGLADPSLGDLDLLLLGLAEASRLPAGLCELFLAGDPDLFVNRIKVLKF